MIGIPIILVLLSPLLLGLTDATWLFLFNNTLTDVMWTAHNGVRLYVWALATLLTTSIAFAILCILDEI